MNIWSLPYSSISDYELFFAIENIDCDWNVEDKNIWEHSITYGLVINKYDSGNIDVYYDRENYMHLYYNGYTKYSHNDHENLWFKLIINNAPTIHIINRLFQNLPKIDLIDQIII